MLDEAQALVAGGEKPRNVIVAIVWEGAPRGSDDLTAHFGEEARARGFEVFEILTL